MVEANTSPLLQVTHSSMCSELIHPPNQPPKLNQNICVFGPLIYLILKLMSLQFTPIFLLMTAV